MYTNHGPKSRECRRPSAPTSRNGTRTTLAIITTKLPIASRRPSTRDSTIGPQPWARKLVERRVGGDRVPLGDVADPQRRAARGRRRDRAEDDELARPPRAHDDEEEHERRHAGQDRDRRPLVDVAPRAPAAACPQDADTVGEPDEPDGSGQQDAVVAGQGRQPGQQAGDGERPAVALEAAGGEPQRRRDERMEDREVLGLGHEHGRGPGDRGDDAGGGGDDRAGAGVAGDHPRQRRDQRADEHARAWRSRAPSGRGAR